MKKRLLITSIVMMLVVAVALSTATYAWFTSNATVKAQSVTMTASVNDAAAIGIAWVGSDAGKTPLAAANSGNLNPMIPAAFTSTTKDSEMGYNASTVYTDDNGTTYKFNAAGTTETPYIWNDGTAGTPVETFYIRNLSATTAVNVTIKVLIFDKMDTVEAGSTLDDVKSYYKLVDGIYTLMTKTGDNKDYTAGETKAGAGAGNIGYAVYTPNTTVDVSSLVRVAVFTCDTVDGNYVLSNVFTELGGTNVSAGTIAANEATTTYQNTKTSIAQNTATSLKANLAGATNLYVRVHVWLDGDGFVDNLGGGQANVALIFDAAKVGAGA